MFKDFKPKRAESILEYCYHVNAVPFVWHRNKPAQVTLLKSYWRRLLVRSSQFIVFANIPFLALGLWLKWKTYVENEMFVELTIHTLWLVFYCSCISMQVLYVSKEKEVCDTVNEIYKFVAVTEKYFKSPEFERKRRLQDWLVMGAAFYTIGGSLFGVVMFLTFHRQSWYFLFSFSDETKQEACGRIWPILIFTLIELWFEITQWVSFVVLTYINALFLLNVGTCLNLLMRKIVGRSKMEPGILTKINRTYSKIYLIQTAYNDCFGTHFWPLFNAGNGCCITGTLSGFIITLEWSVPFVTVFIGSFVVIALSITSITMQFTSGIHHLSHMLIRAVASKQLCKHSKRIHKCMQICAIKVGSYFVIERKTFLTLVAVVVNSVATILLSGTGQR